MNFDTIKGHWKELKADLQKKWGDITDDEWETTKGDANQISGLIQKKYGQTKDNVSDEVRRMFDRYNSTQVQDKNNPI